MHPIIALLFLGYALFFRMHHEEIKKLKSKVDALEQKE